MLQIKMVYVLIILLLVSSESFSNKIVIAQTTGIPELDDAELRFSSVLKAVQNADKNGIDVQSYVSELNDALARALARGNLTQVEDLATSVFSNSTIVERLAYNVSLSTERTKVENGLTLIYSIILLMISEAAIYFGWITFKRRYLLKMMEMEPRGKSQ
jgi:hypothetical protein